MSIISLQQLLASPPRELTWELTHIWDHKQCYMPPCSSLNSNSDWYPICTIKYLFGTSVIFVSSSPDSTGPPLFML